jgi:hypothetical protein
MIAIIKRYIDAKVAHAIRQQAWMNLSWDYAGDREKRVLETAEQEISSLVESTPQHCPTCTCSSTKSS